MFKPPSKYPVDLAVALLLYGGVTAYCDERDLAIIHSHGNSSVGSAPRYWIFGTDRQPAPSFRAWTETEAIERTEAWLKKNQGTFEHEGFMRRDVATAQ